MKIINNKTGVVLDLLHVDTRSKIFYAIHQEDLKSDETLKSFTFANNPEVDELFVQVLYQYLVTLPEYVDFIPYFEYVNWEVDGECENRPYRIYLTFEQSATLVEKAPQFIAKRSAEGSSMITKKFDSKGHYIYLSFFDKGDPWGLLYLFGSGFVNNFEKNPLMDDVPDIDFSPNEEQQAMIQAAMQAEQDRLAAIEAQRLADLEAERLANIDNNEPEIIP